MYIVNGSVIGEHIHMYMYMYRTCVCIYTCTYIHVYASMQSGNLRLERQCSNLFSNGFCQVLDSLGLASAGWSLGSPAQMQVESSKQSAVAPGAWQNIHTHINVNSELQLLHYIVHTCSLEDDIVYWKCFYMCIPQFHQ